MLAALSFHNHLVPYKYIFDLICPVRHVKFITHIINAKVLIISKKEELYSEKIQYNAENFFISLYFRTFVPNLSILFLL